MNNPTIAPRVNHVIRGLKDQKSIVKRTEGYATELKLCFPDIKQSLYRFRQALRAPKISRQPGHEGGKVIGATLRPTLPPSIYHWYCYILSRPQGHSGGGRIKSMTPSGIEPTVFRLVAQCLNQLPRRVPLLQDINKTVKIG